MTAADELEAQVEAALADRLAGDGRLRPLLEALYDRYREHCRLLDRLVRISDHYQKAERDRGEKATEHYQRELRRIEKIVRISDRYQTMMHELNDRLQLMSTTDDLTGLFNRRRMREQLQGELTRNESDGTSFCVGMVDIDHFKTVNDTWGHSVGDVVLRAVAEELRRGLMPEDACARWGGEEFLILFSDCAIDAARPRAEQLLPAISGLAHAAQNGQTFNVTISLGLTLYRSGESIDALLRRADAALYEAKAEGRNRMVTRP